MSSRKLDFKAWCNNIGVRECYPTTKCDDCKAAWNFAEAQEKREYELLEAEHSGLLTNFCKVDMERIKLGRESEELKLQNKKAINAFKALNRYLCNGEHVDLCWIKDEIQLQAESESLTKSRHSLEIAKYKREIEELQKKVEELEKEGFTLSANQCCAEDCGIHFEEGTSLFCKHEQENKALKKKLGEAVECIEKMCFDDCAIDLNAESRAILIDVIKYHDREARAFLKGNKDE